MRHQQEGDEGRRRTEEVFHDHLRLGLIGSVEEDLARNYAQDVVILTGWGIARGHDGLRELSNRLQQQLPNCSFRYGTQLVAEEFAFLEWTAVSDAGQVRDGADSYVIRNGRIVAQTIHYTIEP